MTCLFSLKHQQWSQRYQHKTLEYIQKSTFKLSHMIKNGIKEYKNTYDRWNTVASYMATMCH